MCLGVVLVEDVRGDIGGLVRENHWRTRWAEEKNKSETVVAAALYSGAAQW